MRTNRINPGYVLIVLMTVMAMIFNITSINIHAEGSIPDGNVYFSDDLTIPLDFTTTDVKSQNSHTKPFRLWRNNDIVYIAVSSTHKLASININGTFALAMKEHAIKEFISVTSYDQEANFQSPIPLVKGNVAASRWTVASFPLEILNQENQYILNIIGNGGGHSIDGILFSLVIPKVTAKVTKEWRGGPKPPVTVQLYKSLDASLGEKVKEITLNADRDGKVSHFVTDLDKTNVFGKLLNYKFYEENVPNDYRSEVIQHGYDSDHKNLQLKSLTIMNLKHISILLVVRNGQVDQLFTRRFNYNFIKMALNTAIQSI